MERGGPAGHRRVPQLTSFDAVAGADGVRVLVEGPAPLLLNVFDGGVPVSQALVNGMAARSRLASVPCPGDTLLAAPGLVFPVVGLPAPPDYPLIAWSAAPNKPKAAVELGRAPHGRGAQQHALRRPRRPAGRGRLSGANAIGRFATAAAVTADPHGGEGHVRGHHERHRGRELRRRTVESGAWRPWPEVRRPAAGSPRASVAGDGRPFRAAGTVAIGVTVK